MVEMPTQSRGGVKGQLPLAGSRDSVPCGVWGNAPTVPRPTNPKEVANKGAGSEASLPVTLRVRRRAPKLLFPQDSVKNHCFPFCRPCNDKNQVTWEATAKGSRGRPQTSSVFIAPLSPPQRRNPLLAGKSSYGRKTSNPVAPIWRDTA